MSSITFAHYDSPIGKLTISASEEGIAKISFPNGKSALPVSSKQSTTAPKRSQGLLEQARQQLDEYFAGKRKRFDLKLDLSSIKGTFARKVLAETAAVPYGQTISYAELADRAGSARAVRAVGNAMATNPLPLVIPCHRVLRTDGTVGQYGGGTENKRLLLKLENAAI